MQKTNQRIRTFTIKGSRLRGSIYEINNSGIHFKGGRIKPSKDSTTVQRCIAVVFMYNPVVFGPGTTLNNQTLNVIIRVLGEIMINSNGIVRVYNLTVVPSKYRGDLWNVQGENPCDAVTRLLAAKDECLVDDEQKANWWIAWNLKREKTRNWLKGREAEERNFRSERWDTIKGMIDENDRSKKTYAGLNADFLFVQGTLLGDAPLANGLFIHPSNMFFCKSDLFNDLISALKQ